MTESRCESHDIEPGSIHCLRQVGWQGIRGLVGCHEDFASGKAYWAHLYRGGCRNPENVNLKWNGASWSFREPEVEGVDR